MSRHSFVIAIALVLFTGAGTALPEEKKPAPSTHPDSVRAWRIIALAASPSMTTLQDMVLPIAREQAGILGVAPEVVGELYTIEPRGGQLTDPPPQIELSVRTDKRAGVQPRALEFLDAVTRSLDDRLREWQVEYSGLARHEQSVQRLEHSLAEARSRLSRTEEAIRQKTGRVDASLEPIRAAVPKLEEERQSLKLQVVGKQARQKALAETIERLAKAAGERAQSDPVAEELEKVVEARQEQIAALRHGRAAVSAVDLSQATAALAEARARVLERREAVVQANGGELLAGLNRELATLSIDAVEGQARLAAIEELLAKYGSVQDLLTDAADLRREQDRIRDKLLEARKNVEEIRNSLPQASLRIIRTESMAGDDPWLNPADSLPGE